MLTDLCRGCGYPPVGPGGSCLRCPPDPGQAPATITVARVLLIVSAVVGLLSVLFWAVTAAGLASLAASWPDDGTTSGVGPALVLLVVALTLQAALCVAMLRLQLGVGRRRPLARSWLTFLGVVDAVALIAGAAPLEIPALVVLVGVAWWAAALTLLWIPETARRWFGDLPATTTGARAPGAPRRPAPSTFPAPNGRPGGHDMRTCPWCGRPAAASQPCSGCGRPDATPRPASTPTPPPGQYSPAGATASPIRLVPAGAFALAALLALFWAVSNLTSSFIGSIAVTLLPALVVPALLALVAAGLARGKRVARAGAATAVPLLGVLAVASYAPALLVLGFLLTGAAVVALVLVPDLRAHVAQDRPTLAPSVTLARVTLTVFSCGAVLWSLVSVLFLLISAVSYSALPSGDEYGLVTAVSGGLLSMAAGAAVVVLALSGGLAVFGFWARAALARRSGLARVLVTVVASLALLLLLVASVPTPDTDETVVLPAALAALHAALLVLLWVPSDARVYFGDRPIAAVEDLRRQLTSATSGLGAPHASGWPAPGPSGYGGGHGTQGHGTHGHDTHGYGTPTGYGAPATSWPSSSPWPSAGASGPGSSAWPSTPPRPAGPPTPSRPAGTGDAATEQRLPALEGETTSLQPVSEEPVGAAAVIPSARACPACHRPAEAAWSHCPNCGARLASRTGEPHS